MPRIIDELPAVLVANKQETTISNFLPSERDEIEQNYWGKDSTRRFDIGFQALDDLFAEADGKNRKVGVYVTNISTPAEAKAEVRVVTPYLQSKETNDDYLFIIDKSYYGKSIKKDPKRTDADNELRVIADLKGNEKFSHIAILLGKNEKGTVYFSVLNVVDANGELVNELVGPGSTTPGIRIPPNGGGN